jgi:hypothetical protein
MAIHSGLLFLDRFALKYSPQSPTPFRFGEGVAWLPRVGGGVLEESKGRKYGWKLNILQIH